MKAIFYLITLVLTLNSHASMFLQDLNIPFNPEQVELIGRDGKFYLNFQQYQILNRSDLIKLNKEFGHYTQAGDQYSLLRWYRLPVELSVNAKGFDWSFQILGINDNKIKTGYFQKLKGHRVSDLFRTYNGFSRGLGILLGGLGKTSATNDTGIIFQQWNGAVVIPQPGVFGVSLGLKNQKFSLNIFPASEEVEIFETLRLISSKEFQPSENSHRYLPLSEFKSSKF